MIAILVVHALAVVVVALVAWRFGRDRRGKGISLVRWPKIVALIPLGLQVCIFTMANTGLIPPGYVGGARTLIPLAAAVLLAVLAWMRPVEGGVALLAVGVASLLEYHGDETATTFMAYPELVSGCLFLVAGMAGWRAAPPRVDKPT